MAELEVYPGFVHAAGRRFTDAGGRRYSPIMATALWTLARHLDPIGRGRVHLADLQRAGMDLWSRATYYRALRDAEELGLVRQVTRRRDGARMLTCTGAAKVAELLDLPSVGARKVSISLEALATSKKFKSALWSAYHAGRSRNTGAPITRRTLCALSGVPESTQRNYEHDTLDAGGCYRITGKTPNAVVLATNATPDQLQAARGNVHGGCYLDRHTGDLLRPIGNTYSSSLTAGSRSRARKLNRSLSHRPGALLPPGSLKRLFFVVRPADALMANVKRAERAARQGRAADVPLAATGTRSNGATLWTQVLDSWALAHVAGV